MPARCYIAAAVEWLEAAVTLAASGLAAAVALPAPLLAARRDGVGGDGSGNNPSASPLRILDCVDRLIEIHTDCGWGG